MLSKCIVLYEPEENLCVKIVLSNVLKILHNYVSHIDILCSI